MTSADCDGCQKDRYNRGYLGSWECRELKTATLVMREEVCFDGTPPENTRIAVVPSCYRRFRYLYTTLDKTK